MCSGWALVAVWGHSRDCWNLQSVNYKKSLSFSNNFLLPLFSWAVTGVSYAWKQANIILKFFYSPEFE